MSTPTWEQAQQILEQLGQVSEKRIEALLQSGVLSTLAKASSGKLRQLDHNKLEALLADIQEPFQWSQPVAYSINFSRWGRHAELDIDLDEALQIGRDLPRPGPYSAPGVQYYSGKGLQADWNAAVRVLRYELNDASLGLDLDVIPHETQLEYFRNLRIDKTSPATTPAVISTGNISLAKYWSNVGQASAFDLLMHESRWPSLDILWLLALNPRLLIDLSTDLAIPGLQTRDGNIVYIWRDEHTVYIDTASVYKREHELLLPAYE